MLKKIAILNNKEKEYLEFDSHKLIGEFISGNGQLLDTGKDKVLWVSPANSRITSVLKTSLPDLILVGMENLFQILGGCGIIKEFRYDFPIDGFYFKEQKGKVVSGYFDSSINLNEEPIFFDLSLDSLEITIKY